MIVMKNKYLNAYLNKGVVHMYSTSDRNAEKQTTDFHGKVKKMWNSLFRGVAKYASLSVSTI